MKTILKKVVTTNFTVVPNYLTEDPDLSWKAKGILVYLLGRPNDWEINIPHLSSVSSDGESSTRSGFSELETAGYAKRVRHTDDSGRITSWSVYVRQDKNDVWPFENPDVENPHVENPVVENHHQLNKDNTNKEFTNKETTNGHHSWDEVKEERNRAVAEKDQHVSEVWEAYIGSLDRFKPNKRKPVMSKTRIDLIKRRLKEYSVEDLKLAVTGWEHSDFHCGKNENGKVWNSIELLLRNSEKIEQFIEYHNNPVSNDVNNDWGRDKMKITSTTIIVNEED